MLKLNSAKTSIEISGIFACNDDMAIGARSAVIALKLEGYKFVNGMAIVGYDGVKEAVEYITANDEYLVGTVDVQISEQAKSVISIIQSRHHGSKNQTRIKLIPPIAITSEKRG